MTRRNAFLSMILALLLVAGGFLGASGSQVLAASGATQTPTPTFDDITGGRLGGLVLTFTERYGDPDFEEEDTTAEQETGYFRYDALDSPAGTVILVGYYETLLIGAPTQVTKIVLVFPEQPASVSDREGLDELLAEFTPTDGACDEELVETEFGDETITCNAESLVGIRVEENDLPFNGNYSAAIDPSRDSYYEISIQLRHGVEDEVTWVEEEGSSTSSGQAAPTKKATAAPTKRPTVRPTRVPTKRPTVRPTSTPDYGGSTGGGGGWPSYAEDLLLGACIDAGEGYTFCLCLVAAMETLVSFEDFLVASDYYNTWGEFPGWFSDAFAIAYYACL